MAFRTINTAAVSTLSQAQRDALAAQALARTPIARISLWPNNNRRPDKNDAQFTGKLQLSTVQLAEKLAAALAEGKSEVDLWIDVWHNEPSVGKSGGERPVLSGRARNFVEPRYVAGSDAQSESINDLLREAAAGGVK